MNQNQSRKHFLKSIVLLAGTAISLGFSDVFNEIEQDTQLTKEQKEFFIEYKKWLNVFHKYVSRKNIDSLDLANNKKLMQLSAEAEKRKPIIEKYMNDKNFARYFHQIAKKTSNII